MLRRTIRIFTALTGAAVIACSGLAATPAAATTKANCDTKIKTLYWGGGVGNTRTGWTKMSVTVCRAGNGRLTSVTGRITAHNNVQGDMLGIRHNIEQPITITRTPTTWKIQGQDTVKSCPHPGRPTVCGPAATLQLWANVVQTGPWSILYRLTGNTRVWKVFTTP